MFEELPTNVEMLLHYVQRTGERSEILLVQPGTVIANVDARREPTMSTTAKAARSLSGVSTLS